MLTSGELSRYHRHIILPQIGVEGQLKLKKSRVLVIGAGGLGCPVLQYLVAAGVGEIGIVDFDRVEESNLQRQILFTPDDLGKFKAETAAKKLSAQNPGVKFKTLNTRISRENAQAILRDFDVIVDGTDNFPSRYLISDVCTLLDKPLVFGSIFRFEGQVTVFNYQNGPTYRCLFPEPPKLGEVPTCSEAGVFGVLPGIVGCLQANEVIKIITGAGEVLSGKLLSFDSLKMDFDVFDFERVVGLNNTDVQAIDYEEVCEANLKRRKMKEISAEELNEMLAKGEDIQIVDVRDPLEFEICNIGGDLIPLGKIPINTDKINKDKPVVFVCHHGLRSATAINFLEENHNFKNLYNLKGGIHSWAEKVDREMARY